MAQLGGLEDEPAGLDLRGAFVGSEGTLGIATKIAVRLTPNPPAVRTLLLSFPTVRDAAQTVSDVIAAGVVPAALEVMDQRMTAAVENYAAAGYPTDAAAVLLAEVEGLDGGVERDADRVADIGRANNATAVRLAASGRNEPPSGKVADGLRRRRPDRPTTTCTTRSYPGPSWPTSSNRSTRSATATT